tara:strand:+ start:2106 stop:2948 length:843 start_codon:yes stop_codon:yes gene_type:complete
MALTAKTGGGAAAATSSGGGGAVVGQAMYNLGGISYWTCPAGVTSVCVVCIGGGEAMHGSVWANDGGYGGGLGWKNDIPVTPGTSYDVMVGRAGGSGRDPHSPSSGNSYHGGDSYFIDTSTVKGGGGGKGSGYTGDGGGNGGTSSSWGYGCGAGGYTGDGGSGNGDHGAGGGGASGSLYSSSYGGAAGGGTGPWGQGPSGVATSACAGEGGSGGESGHIGENPFWSYGCTWRKGGDYGGGAGGPGSGAPWNHQHNVGGRGCVRIIWGAGRAFPDTKTGDM